MIIYQERFEKAYPFTTENIDGYYNEIDFEGKKVLTVGSSLDQAINALYLGAKNVVVYDICRDLEKFGKYKINKLKSSKTTDEFIEDILTTEEIEVQDRSEYTKEQVKRINPYLKDDDSFEKTRQIVSDKEQNITYINKDIFDGLKINEEEKFDIIITSNVTQYLDDYIALMYYPKPIDRLKVEDLLMEVFYDLKSHLKDDGVLQFAYKYAVQKIFSIIEKPNDYEAIINSTEELLKDEEFDIKKITSIDNKYEDEVIMYRKK